MQFKLLRVQEQCPLFQSTTIYNPLSPWLFVRHLRINELKN